MIDLIPVEVYAYESEKLLAEGADERTSGYCPADTTDSDRSAIGHECKVQATSRLIRTIQVSDLPPLPRQQFAFKCFSIQGERDLFAGRHDGVTLHWQIQQVSSFHPPPVSVLRGHTGSVLSITFASELGKSGLLFTGSADRTIRVWDPWSGTESHLHGKRDSSARSCVQTLTGHDAGVSCIQVVTHQHDALVSCSLDRSVRTWLKAEGRGLLLYPWYLPGQIIMMAGGSWPSSLCVRAGASCTMFVADSSGSIALYTSEASTSDSTHTANEYHEMIAGSCDGDTQLQFKLKRKYSHFHSLGIASLQLVADNCFVVSLGFDEKAQVIDAISGALSATIACPSGLRFTSCCWDVRGQSLVLGDSNSAIHWWSMLEDKVTDKKQVTASKSTQSLVAVQTMALAGSTFVFTGFANGMKQWLVNRDVGYVDFVGHTEGIVSIVTVEDEYEFLDPGLDGHRDNTESPTAGDSARFFSASLDNTIRCWSAYDNKAAFGFEERGSEITCMAKSTKFRKLFTGHDAGTVKAWGAHTGEFVQAVTLTKSSITCLDSGIIRDEEFLVAGDISGAIWVWEINYESLQPAGKLCLSPDGGDERSDEVSAILFCEALYLNRTSEEFVVAGHSSGLVHVWSFAKKAVISSFKAHDDLISSFVMHGCFLFSSSDDGLLRMWNFIDPSDPYELGVLRPPSSLPSLSSPTPSSPIVSLDVVPPRGFIASVAADGSLIVWDYADFEDKNAFDACGKIVFQTKVDDRPQCVRYWQPRRALICGTADGRLLEFALPAKSIILDGFRSNVAWRDIGDAMGKVRFAVLGDTFVDVVAGTLAPEQLPKWGGDVECSRPIELQPGGSALNTATHIANLARGNTNHDISVDLHTVVGTDSFADVVKNHLDAHRVTLHSPAIEGVPTGVCIVLSGTEDRSFLTHYGAARKFSVEHIDEATVLAADHLHIGGFYSCPNLQSKLKSLLEKARAKGITTSLDTNYDPTETWGGLDELYPLLDVFMPNEVEAMKVSKTESVEDAMAFFANRINGTIVIKVGEGGVVAHCTKTQRSWKQGTFPTSVVDVTGAGDSFDSGFLVAWKTNGSDVAEALKWGCATASKIVAVLGACSSPIEFADVQSIIARKQANANE